MYLKQRETTMLTKLCALVQSSTRVKQKSLCLKNTFANFFLHHTHLQPSSLAHLSAIPFAKMTPKHYERQETDHKWSRLNFLSDSSSKHESVGAKFGSFPGAYIKVANVQHNDVIQGGRLVVEFANAKSEKTWRSLAANKMQRQA